MEATIRKRKFRAIVTAFLCVAASLGTLSSAAFSISKRTSIRSDVAQAENLCERGKWKDAYRLADSVVVAIRVNEYDKQGTRAQIEENQEYLSRAFQTMEVCATHFSEDASNIDEEETLIFEF